MVILRYAPKIGLEETTSALDERYRRCMRPSSWKISRSNGRCFATAPKDGTIRITISNETLNGTVWEIRDNNRLYYPTNIRVFNHPSYLKLHFGAEWDICRNM